MDKLSAAIIVCCLHVLHCKEVAVNLGNTTEFYGLKGQSVLMQCVLNSGNFTTSQLRRWLADGVILMTSGVPSSAGSQYRESLGVDRFSLTTPTLDNSYNGTTYRCTYGFQQAYIYLRIAEIEGISQSSEKCIDKTSIGTCTFSLSKVIPEISSPNLTVSYQDGTMENITSMLNVSSQMNPDGTNAYQFTIVPDSISKDVKSITLSFTVYIYLKTLTITAAGCKYSDVELIFGGVSCFLIVLITSIIMLIILGCKILLEIFGDIKQIKVIIIIVFVLFALIIGLALGFSLTECDQRDLGLGLGLGFGFILAIALVLTLYIYHKQCGSRTGVSRRAMEYISCTQSGQ